MAITRRQFLQRGAMTAAAVTAPNPLLRAMVGTANAAPANPILVVVQLEGGNDGLNMVVPVDDGGPITQRSLYDAARPNIGIAAANLAATTLGVDPNGTTLALHPAMTGLKALFDAGKLAVVNGVGYPNQSLSHFRSEDIWYSGNPNLSSSGGWIGRYLDAYYTPSDLITVDFNETLLPVFVCGDCNVLAVRRISDFVLPQDAAHPDDSAAKKAALEAAYTAESDPLQTSGTHLTIGVSGNVLIDHVDLYAQVSTSGLTHLGPINTSFADRLRQVAAVIRYDVQHPATPTGARFFHVRQGGFDNHTNQGADTGTHSTNLKRISDSVKAFIDDMQAIGGNALTDRILLVTFSEFGRRVAENGTPTTAGTDHGAAAPLFVVGNAVTGGLYGKLPALNDLSSGNLKFHTDFRQVYATVIDKWLATPGAHVPLLPGGPFPLLPFLA